MNSNFLRSLLIFLVGLTLGLAAGAWGFRFFLSHGGGQRDPAQFFVNRLDRELQLTADQKTRITAIIQSKKAEMDALRDATRPKFEAVRKDGDEQIKKVLTPGQLPKFEEMLKRFEKRRMDRGDRQGWGRHGGPDGGPDGPPTKPQ